MNHPIGDSPIELVDHFVARLGLQRFVIAGSSGYLEISSSQASAAKMLGCGVGAPVELRIL